MVWVRVDDRFHDHRKVRGLAPSTVGVWTLAASWCGANSQDGFVPDTVLRRWSGWRRAATELEKAGLWEPGTVGREQGWHFHDWARYNPPERESADDAAKLKAKRKRELRRMPELRERVIARDGTRCRYCAVRVNFSDHKSQAGGELDHIDPDGPNTYDNLVVACKRCNGNKRDRTPDEAGMVLMPEPIHDRSTTDPRIGNGSSVDRSTPVKDPPREAGPVTDRSRVGPGPGHGSASGRRQAVGR